MSGVNLSDCPAMLPGARLRLALGMRSCCVLSATLLALVASADAEPPVVDADGDGLIELHTIEDLNSIRYNLDGFSLKHSPDDPGNSKGCPDGACIGYELMANLDFDGPDDDTTTWTRNAGGSLTLDKDDHNSAWFDVEAGGWQPIGDCGPDGQCVDFYDDDTDEDADNRPFVAIFEGNGHTITNLVTMRALPALGLFGHLGSTGEIRNLGLVGNLAACFSSSLPSSVGGLVGYQLGGAVAASYATGDAEGRGAGCSDVGGLVGFLHDGFVTNSYATGSVAGGSGFYDNVGGLVGVVRGGSIADSYAAGSVNGGDGGRDDVGGLAGVQSGGIITGSYATGDVDGGRGMSDQVGGLVGTQREGSIVNSYASGHAYSGDFNIRDSDIASSYSFEKVGGLVGDSGGFIIASYSTGDAVSSGGDRDFVGGLAGVSGGTIIASYSTGNAEGGGGDEDHVGGLVALQRYGSIVACYSTGNAGGGGGHSDKAGGLVGHQGNGSIIASYATSDADGGEPTPGLWGYLKEAFGYIDWVGGLVGQAEQGSIVSASWGFGFKFNGDPSGSDGTEDKPIGVKQASDLTIGSGDESTDTPLVWNSDADGTHGAWDFGTSRQNPALAYADYDGEGSVYHCAADADNAPEGAILIPHCTSPATLIPGQREEE